MPWRYKVTLLFEGAGMGWSETWYKSTENPGMTGVIKASEGLRMARSLLLGPNVQIVALRVTTLDVLRQTAIRTYWSSVATAPGYSDYPSATIVGEVSTVPYAKRVVYLRGYPDGWVYREANYDIVMPSDLARIAYDVFVEYLSKEGWDYKATERRDGKAVGDAIMGVSKESRYLSIFVPDAEIYEPGNRVSIKYVQGPSPAYSRMINRTFQVRSTDAGWLVLNTDYAPFGPLGLYTGGLAYRKTSGYYTVTGGKLIRTGERRAGRTFFVPPGRRKARNRFPVIPVAP